MRQEIKINRLINSLMDHLKTPFFLIITIKKSEKRSNQNSIRI